MNASVNHPEPERSMQADTGLLSSVQPSGRRFLRSLFAGLILVVALSMLSIVLVMRQFQDSALQSRAVVHSHHVLDGLSSIQDLQQLAMNDLRTYVNGGTQDALQIYQESVQQLPGRFERLSSLLETDVERQQLSSLRQLSNENYSWAEQVLAEYALAGKASFRLPGLMRGNGMGLSKFRQFVSDWRGREEAMLSKEVTLAEQRLASARRYALGSLLAAAGLILLLGTLLLRHIRHREQIQQHLQLTSRIWRGTLESLVQGVGLYSMDNRLMMWNRRYAEIQGIDPDKLYQSIPAADVFKLSMRLADRDAKTEQADMISAAELVRTQGGQYLECVRMDGMVVQSAALPMTQDYYVLTLNDVTAMRESERLARDQAIRLAAIMDNAPDAIITASSAGLIESWSAGAQRIFGYASDEVLHRSIAILMAEPYASALDGYLEKLGQENSSLLGKRLELKAQHRHHHEFHVDLVLSKMHIGVQPLFVGIVRDLTEHHAVERMKREFVSTVTHELRTPLTSISGSLGLMMAGAGGELPVKARHLLTIARKNSDRLAVLINDILDLEKIESGSVGLKLQPGDLSSVLQQSVEVNRAYAQVRKIRFQLQTPGESLQVMMDEKRIIQVMTNLLSNAAKFSPAGATVLIRLERYADHARVSVHDDGPGVPAEFHDRIFTRFAQADGSDKRSINGSGLGLAISKSLIERHHGQMEFSNGQSATGKGGGATFWFDLPLIPLQQPTMPVTQASEANFSAANPDHPVVLHVEADESIAATVQVLLQNEARMVVASSFAQARARLQEYSFSLIILEPDFAHDDGNEWLLELRQLPHAVPVVLYSAAEVDHELNSLVQATLLKSRDSMDELKAVVLRALPQR